MRQLVKRYEEEMAEQIPVQMDNNSHSIEHILRPISYTSWLLGVGVAHPRNCSKTVTIIIRIVHLAVCSVSVVHSVLDFSTFDTDLAHDSGIFKFMYCMNRIMCYVLAYYNIYYGIRQCNKWSELMNRMEKLNQKIKKETPLKDVPVKKMEALAILVTFACCPLLLIIHVLYYYYTHPEFIFVSDLLFYYMLAQSLINSFVFDVIVYVLYYKFRLINELIGQLDELFGAQWIAHKIRRVRELHNGKFLANIILCIIIIRVLMSRRLINNTMSIKRLQRF
ncbi:uncharacterized protein LOC105835625 [Monomorium pharaonis]|uniref:uncharacterized protein LOC105835625 n=1 Tax=Monomorium pharaonis TaxID=307658 RepID=UPI001745F23F|nr:uncharacterized protein LOC105835625 [Monomorium pharaonis]